MSVSGDAFNAFRGVIHTRTIIEDVYQFGYSLFVSLVELFFK